MNASLRAAADQLLYDDAMLIHIASGLEEGDLGGICAATGWTARQSFAHIAFVQREHAATLEAVVRGGQPPSGLDAERRNALIAEEHSATPLPELLATLRDSRDRLFTAFGALTATQIEAPFAGSTLSAAVGRWAAHGELHAMDFTEAITDLRDDAIVLNWVLATDRRGDPALALRQRELIEDVRRRVAERRKQRKKEQDA